MSTTKDRIAELRKSSTVTGIDFISVSKKQDKLYIYFFEFKEPDPPDIKTEISDLLSDLETADIRIYNKDGIVPDILIQSVSWLTNKKNVLLVVLKNPGDFALYKIKINDRKDPNAPYRIDPFYNDVSFSFKANCESDLDCKPAGHECPPEELIDFPINYLARDFWSFRTALLDFASLRYPDWADRLEADAGVMMAELISALGDEMAYYQDRVNREAYLETATQRRSIRRHARLIDYQMHDGLGAKVWIDINVEEDKDSEDDKKRIVEIPVGTNVFALSDDNTRIDFEIGNGINRIRKVLSYKVNSNSNKFEPHIWDENDKCLPAGATKLYLMGYHAADLAFDDFPKDKAPGKWVLLQTKPTDPAQPARDQVVRLIEVTETKDPVLIDPDTNEEIKITHIVWEQEQALKFEFDLTTLTIRGNIVPATAGKTYTTCFIVDKPPESLIPAEGTVNRNGHDESNSYLFTLPFSQNSPLVYLDYDPHEYNVPEILLEEVDFDSDNNSMISKIPPKFWEYKCTLVGISSSNPTENHFTLDDGSWQRVVGYQRSGEEIVHRDYVMNNGVTIRFGDGEFGKVPDKGTIFRVSYRLGGTRRSNVAAGTIKFISTPTEGVTVNNPFEGVTVNNPLPSTGGMDAETATEVRQLAPEAYRAITYRAVRPEDYAEAAERLPWVQKAGASFRWTGSWLTAFVTPDTKDKVTLEKEERRSLTNQLNRFRQAGREVNVMDPEYANIDLDIKICVASDAYPGQVKERVYKALLGKIGLRPEQGYFSPDRFTFGTSLERSTLEAAIQNVPGVKTIENINFRRKGWFEWRVFSGLSYDPGKNSIIRIANDPLHPERGTLKLDTHGGL